MLIGYPRNHLVVIPLTSFLRVLSSIAEHLEWGSTL